jgi:hypothetical protein
MPTDRKPDIVRIDDFGVARPTDRGAVQRFKTAKGSYRLLPSPPRFVMLEKFVEGGDSLHLRLGGEITAAGMLCDVCGLIAQAGWRGEMIVWSFVGSNDTAARSIFFEDGNVLGAQSTAPGERLGEIMYKLGALTKEQILDVSRKTTPERRFGETAVDLGYLARGRLFELIRTQTEEIVRAALFCDEGTYWFLDGFDPSRLAYRHRVSAQGLLLDCVRRMDEANVIRGPKRPRPTTPRTVVEMHNHAIRPILAAADQTGRGGELRARLATYASGVGVYDALFVGAGPHVDGSIDPDRVANNVMQMGGDDPISALSQWLHEYVSFALFDLATELPKSRARELSDRVAEPLAMLAPMAPPSSLSPNAQSRPPMHSKPSVPSKPISRPPSIPSPPPPQLPALAPMPTPPPNTRPSLTAQPVVPKTTQVAMATPPPPPPPAPEPLAPIFEDPARDPMPMPVYTAAPITAADDAARAQQRKKSGAGLWILFTVIVLGVAFAVGAVLAGVIKLPGGVQEAEKAYEKPKKPKPSASASASTSASALASASASALASASASVVSNVPGGMGRLIFKAPAGFRVFVDGKVMGNTPDPVLIVCGTRSVKIGSHGTTQTIEVPCGGEIEVLPK